MLKEPEISRYSTRSTHRTYTPEFKAELVAACQQTGVSIAALAGHHGMNASVLHRWIKEHQHSGCHAVVERPAPNTRGVPAFVPIPLQLPKPAGNAHEIKIQLRRDALTIDVTWPMHAVADLASWTAAVLK